MTLSGGSRISGEGVHIYKGVEIRFADFRSFFLNITETKLFHFQRIFKNGGRGGGSSEPREPPLDPPLTFYLHIQITITCTCNSGTLIVFLKEFFEKSLF